MAERLLAFTGEIGSGKSTAAAVLHGVADVPSAHREFSDLVIELLNNWWGDAAPDEVDLRGLQETIREHPDFITPLTDEAVAEISTEGLKSYLSWRKTLPPGRRLITRTNKDAHRWGLQWCGGALVSVDPRFLADPMGLQVRRGWNSGSELMTISARLDPDAHMIRELGGKVVKVYRPNGRRHPGQSHAVEVGLAPALIDTTVVNDGDLNALRRKVVALWSDYGFSGELKSQY